MLVSPFFMSAWQVSSSSLASEQFLAKTKNASPIFLDNYANHNASKIWPIGIQGSFSGHWFLKANFERTASPHCCFKNTFDRAWNWEATIFDVTHATKNNPIIIEYTEFESLEFSIQSCRKSELSAVQNVKMQCPTSLTWSYKVSWQCIAKDSF